MGHKSKHITETFWVRPQEPRWGLFISTVLTLGVRTKRSTMDNWVPSPTNTGVTLGPRLFVPERVGEDLLYWRGGNRFVLSAFKGSSKPTSSRTGILLKSGFWYSGRGYGEDRHMILYDRKNSPGTYPHLWARPHGRRCMCHR